VRLGARLESVAFTAVYTSPLLRASQTCKLAGYEAVAEVDRDLVEWDYGDYEGRRTADIRKERPDWNLFRDGCPHGETPVEVGARADRVVARVRAATSRGNILVFSSAHFLRVLSARWLGLAPYAGKYLCLSTASLSAVGYEYDLTDPALHFWNDTSHVEA
jgi:probable phosphoglycerate mutase